MVERILFLLSEHEMTAKQLVIKLGLNNSAVSDWKSGRAKPTVDILVKISRLFSVRLDWLINGEGDVYIEQDPEGNPAPQKGQVVFTVKAYGGKTETITMSKEDYERTMPLLERLRLQHEEERGTQDKRKR